jgi:hypothetical protein
LIKRNSNCTGNWSLGGGNFTTTTQQASSNSTAVVSGKLSGLTSFSQFGMGFSPINVLPIELVYFTAVAYKQQINLKWATASETANDFFEVERSIDGINFTAIQWVASKGNSSAMQYYQTVDEPKNTTFNTTYYYRLKQVDFGGQISYSPVRTATIKADANNQTVIGNCYPNPFNNSIIIPIQSESDLLIDCDFINVTGQVLLHLQKSVSKDHPVLELTELELLPKGVYVLKLQSGKELAHRIMQKL